MRVVLDARLVIIGTACIGYQRRGKPG